MPIEFRCPQCQKLLRVPSESAGAKAKCPQCGAIASVPLSDPGETVDPEDGSAAPRVSGDNPFSAGAQPSPSPSKSAGETINPYSAPASGYNPVTQQPSFSGEVVPTPVDAGTVIGYAWEVWKANLGLLVGITVVVFGVNIGFSAAQGAAEAVLRQQGDDAMAGVVSGLISLVSFVFQTFLGIGQARIALKLLRREGAEFSDLFSGGPYFFPVLGASILAGLAMFAGFIACIVPGILLILYFWPFYWLLVDNKATVFQSFGMAQPIGRANAGTSFVLWLASIGIMMAGFLALCVGVLFAAPLVTVMWGAAYLMMSGQLGARPQY